MIHAPNDPIITWSRGRVVKLSARLAVKLNALFSTLTEMELMRARMRVGNAIVWTKVFSTLMH